MNLTNALLFIHAQTSLHAGTGTALGTVDLPIQRERHTGWPTIAGSSLKGIVRDSCREMVAVSLSVQDPEKLGDGKPRDWSRLKRADHDSELNAVFGPPTGQAERHAGAIGFSDARILAFPVRSAKSVFAWITCPAVLERFARDARLANVAVPSIPNSLANLNSHADGFAVTTADSPLRLSDAGQERLLLEEYDFTVVANPADRELVGSIANWLADHAVGDGFTPDRLRRHLVVLSDTEFTHFVRHATEVAARIALDYDTKTVSSGALFYEEFLPAESLLYAILLANDGRRAASNGDRRKTVSMPAAEVMNYVTSRLPGGSILQIGGSATIGKGLCAVQFRGNASLGKEPTA
jgi:CRISPR-associated protein Cmr4